MWTIKLLRFNQVPSDFREPFIISGYRSCRSSIATCLLSAVQWTNETINFWTHFLSFAAFAWMTWGHVRDPHDLADQFTWPFIAFLASSCLYLVASATAHLFNCLSETARHVCFFFDYGAIGLYSLGCSIAYNAYVFPPDLASTALHRVYLPVAVFNGMLCTFLANYSRLVQWEPIRNSGRLLAFLVPYVWCSIPLLCRVILCDSTDCNSDAQLYHVRQFLCALTTALFYATRFPEVLAPGTFDIFGHSHQFFHIGGVLSTYSQYLALSSDMVTRREYILDAVGMPTFLSTAGAFAIVLVGNLLIIWAFFWHVSKPGVLARLRQQGGRGRPHWQDGCGCRCD
ncbi:membrane progestin receptor gamma-like [Diadema setosum]|uniref:membrane progestin receptor gamma-like n=1 Tax=Diadema setosum TaxID=31175 RepID=UPI003B3A4E6B